MTIDFAGLNGYVWWHGVVEDRQDPLKLGRCKVRIIGWHDADVNLIPTEDLPWAQLQMPVSGPRTFFSIKEGEWVTGYFLDGANGQEPIITGVLPGIISQEIRTVNSPVPMFGFTDRRTPAQIANSPRLPDGIIGDVKGEPSIPPTARGKVDGTGIDESNKNLVHVCDISQRLKVDLAVVRVYFSGLMQEIRKGIRALILALGFEPSGEISKLISLAKALARELKHIQSILDDIVDLKNILIDYAKKVAAMIAYILSLPAKLLALLAECLAEFMSSVGSAIVDLFKIPGLEGVDSAATAAELVQAIQDIGDATKGIIKDSIDIITVPAQLVVAVTSVTSSDLADAANTVKGYINTALPNTATVISTNQYSTANTAIP